MKTTNTKIPIVEISEQSSGITKNLFGLMVPGTVAVLAKWENGSTYIYYEGGIYSRKDREPTVEEQIDYAKHAAGRAYQNYPTIAKFVLPEGEEKFLKIVGYVDTEGWEVKFNSLENVSGTHARLSIVCPTQGMDPLTGLCFTSMSTDSVAVLCQPEEGDAYIYYGGKEFDGKKDGTPKEQRIIYAICAAFRAVKGIETQFKFVISKNQIKHLRELGYVEKKPWNVVFHTAKFSMGETAMTAGIDTVYQKRPAAQSETIKILDRHVRGDWGDISSADWKSNDEALLNGKRLHSAYETEEFGRVWVITEWDRSRTTVLYPDEY